MSGKIEFMLKRNEKLILAENKTTAFGVGEMAGCRYGCENRNECKCPQDCVDCHQTVHLEPGCEWPEGKIRCWACAHDRIEKLEAVMAAENKTSACRGW